MTLLTVIDAIAALAYLAMAGLAAARFEGRPTGRLVIAALAATGLFCALEALSLQKLVPAPGHWLTSGFDLARLVAWGAFLALLLRRTEEASPRAGRWLLTLLVGLGAVILVAHGYERQAQTAISVLSVSAGRLVLALVCLALLEEVVRRGSADTRRRLKHLALALGAVFSAEVLIWSEALMLQRADPVLGGARGAISLVAAPLLGLAIVRNRSWSVDLYVSRNAVFQSVMLGAVGVYLIGLAAAGGLLSAAGADWNRSVQIGFLFAGLLLLGTVLVSDRFRSAAQLQLNRVFFRATYDYRHEWRSFVDVLTDDSYASLGERVLHAVTRPLDITTAALWILHEDHFQKVASIGLANDWPGEVELGAWSDEIAEGRLIDLDASQLQPPDWLSARHPARLIVPLVYHSSLMGFLLLQEPRIVRPVGPEERDLLLVAAAQAASYLAEEQATLSLEEGRRFQEVSRRMAFTAHDLRNLANELQLALSNARRHISRPEFQQDLIATMDECVSSMQRLLNKVGQKPEGERAVSARAVVVPVDLVQVVSRSPYVQFAEAPRVSVESEESELLVDGDPDDLAAIAGHLLRNATEVVAEDGNVLVRLRRETSEAVLEVEDDGPGMSPAAASAHIARPFRSDKTTGFGIGLYECRRLAEGLGGRLEIDSARGSGTCVRVTLPLSRRAAEESS